LKQQYITNHTGKLQHLNSQISSVSHCAGFHVVP